MGTFSSARREQRGQVFAAVAAIVVAVNVATGGEAITARIAQASAFVDVAKSVLTLQEAEPEVLVETNDPAPRCRPKVRVRRWAALPGTRVVIRRRWGCRS
jgi:hypothetical protein